MSETKPTAANERLSELLAEVERCDRYVKELQDELEHAERQARSALQEYESEIANAE